MIDVHLSPMHIYINNKVIVNEFSRCLQGYIISISYIPGARDVSGLKREARGREAPEGRVL